MKLVDQKIRKERLDRIMDVDIISVMRKYSDPIVSEIGLPILRRLRLIRSIKRKVLCN